MHAQVLRQRPIEVVDLLEEIEHVGPVRGAVPIEVPEDAAMLLVRLRLRQSVAHQEFLHGRLEEAGAVFHEDMSGLLLEPRVGHQRIDQVVLSDFRVGALAEHDEIVSLEQAHEVIDGRLLLLPEELDVLLDGWVVGPRRGSASNPGGPGQDDPHTQDQVQQRLLHVYFSYLRFVILK